MVVLKPSFYLVVMRTQILEDGCLLILTHVTGINYHNRVYAIYANSALIFSFVTNMMN